MTIAAVVAVVIQAIILMAIEDDYQSPVYRILMRIIGVEVAVMVSCLFYFAGKVLWSYYR